MLVFLLCLLCATALSWSASAHAAPITTVDPEDIYPDPDPTWQSTDVRAVTFDHESTPGTLKIATDLRFVPSANIDLDLFLDTNLDGIADYSVSLIDYHRNRHHDLQGNGGQMDWEVYDVREWSSADCQGMIDGPVVASGNGAPITTAGLQGAVSRFAVEIPLTAIGSPVAFRWTAAGASKRSEGLPPYRDFVPDAANGGTIQWGPMEGEPIDPHDPPMFEGDAWFCFNGRNGGIQVRQAQGVLYTIGGAPPVPSIAQTPENGRPGDTLTFTASVADNRPMRSYEWDLDRDGDFDDATGMSASRQFPSGGRRFVAVRATDTNGLSAVAERSVDILDRAPNVSISQAPAQARPNKTVTLTADATDDGQVVGYAWDLDLDGDFDDATGRTASTTFPQEQTYKVGLRVTDDAGNTADAFRDVEVAERAPTIKLTTSNPRPATKEKYTVSAEVTDDGPIDESKIQWGFDLNPNDADPYNAATGRSFTLSWGWPGTYTMKARYTDESGKTATGRVTVEVPNAPPTFREIRVRKKLTPDQPFNTAPLVKNEELILETLLYDDNSTRPRVDWDLDGDGDYNDATGEKITRAFPNAGPKTAAVRITDQLGATAEGRTAYEVRESADAQCSGRVDQGGMRAVGCFVRQPDGTVATKEPIKINGLDVEPAANTTIRINPLSGIVETGNGNVKIKAGSVVLYEGRWKMDPNCDRYTTECSAFKTSVPAVANLKGLPLKGEAEVLFTPKGTRVKVNVDVFGTIGYGVTARADLTVLDAGGLQLDDLEVRSPMIPLPKNLQIGQFFLKYQGSARRWSGGGYIVLPTPQFTKLAGDFAFGETTGLERVRGEIDGLNVPIDPFATIYLQRIAFTMEIKGVGTNDLRVRMGGGVGASFGPRVGGLDAMTVDGDFLFTFGWPFGMDVEGRLSVAGYDILGVSMGARANGTAYGSGFLGFGLPFPRAQQGVRKDATKTTVSKFNPNADVFNPFQIITVRGEASFWVEPDAFNVEAKVAAKILGISLVEAKALMSSKGVAGCGSILGIAGGFGYEWATDKTDIFGGSCDLSPWAGVRKLEPLDGEGTAREPTLRQVPTSAGSTAPGGAVDLDVPAGQKVLMLKLDGVGGDPVVRVTGPDGKVVEVPAGAEPIQRDDAIVAKNTQEGVHETYVGVKTPAAGRWRVEVLPGSAPLAGIDRAAVLPQPSVKASVSGTGATRTISYDVKEIPGQTVEFAEIGKDVHRVVGAARGARGTLKFTPLFGAGGSRQLVALVQQDGKPRAQFAVARFVAPKPARPARVKGLTARRVKGGKVRVDWKRAPGATRYDVVAVLSDGQGLYRNAKGTTATFSGVELADAARVDVRTVDKRSLVSRAQRVRLASRSTLSSSSKALLPPMTKCVSRRNFTITLDDSIASARIMVNGKVVKTLAGRPVRGRVDLRGLPRGTFAVKITGRTKGGRTVSEQRSYRTCVPAG